MQSHCAIRMKKVFPDSDQNPSLLLIVHFYCICLLNLIKCGSQTMHMQEWIMVNSPFLITFQSKDVLMLYKTYCLWLGFFTQQWSSHLSWCLVANLQQCQETPLTHLRVDSTDNKCKWNGSQLGISKRLYWSVSESGKLLANPDLCSVKGGITRPCLSLSARQHISLAMPDQMHLQVATILSLRL